MKKTKAALGALISAAAIAVFIYLISLFMVFLDSIVGFADFVPKSAGIFIAAALALIGLFWVTWAYGYLLFIGRGSPVELFGTALLPTRNLVTCGPYAYTRNPMLFGVIFFVLAASFYQRSITGLILVPILIFLAVLYLRGYEEPHLEKRFGEAYTRYRAQVPMIFPRFHAIFTGEPEDTCGIAANEKPV